MILGELASGLGGGGGGGGGGSCIPKPQAVNPKP